ncbi:cobalamin biosynthesis protein CobQ [Roseobacter sp. EG26]|uniref:cobalamin biosynthesis protein CobQ n=1 Tax=Roseobacter sp. EG26 TaxID=3412477 RepID=UPI003CE5A8B5
MNTPAHLLIGAAVMGRKGSAAVVWAALIGALLPDLSLYLLAGAAIYLFGIAPPIVFNDLYFSTSWQAIFAIDNSMILWGGLLGVAIWRRSAWAIALTGAALLHLCLDLPLHHDDGRAHFWPLTGWVFDSPVSYWDRDHGAFWVAPTEAILATVAAVLLWQQRFGIGVMVLVGCLLAAELWIVRQWLFYFTDS